MTKNVVYDIIQTKNDIKRESFEENISTCKKNKNISLKYKVYLLKNYWGNVDMKLRTKIYLLFIVLFLGIFFLPNKSEANSVQSAIWFMEGFNITQSTNVGSHEGTQNFDVYWEKNGEIKAPFDCKVVAYYPAEESGNTVVVESIAPVRYANGTIEYMSMAFAHGNDIKNCISAYENGTIIKQGDVFYHQGNYGKWQGNSVNTHCHVTCIVGKYSEQKAKGENLWSSTSYSGIGYTKYNIDPTEALVIPTNIPIIQTQGLNFRFKVDLTEKNTLEWEKHNGENYYEVYVTKNGKELPQEIIKPLEESTVTYDVAKLGGGSYSIYIKAYNANNEWISTSAIMTFDIENVEFKDPKFETWMVSRYDENKDGKIQISEIPSELFFEEQDMYDEFDFDDCSIVYPENIDWINSVNINSCAYVKASQFKGMKNISSVTSLYIGASYLLGVDNIDELLSYFPNVKKLYIGGIYHPREWS